MADVFRTFISYADTVEADRAALAEEPGGAGMLTTGLSADGLPPATAFISSGFVDAPVAVAARMANTMIVEDKNPFDMMAELGLQLVQEPLTIPAVKSSKKSKR